MKARSPRRGELWLLNLDPARGHEQAGRRPALVVSDDDFNRLPIGLAVVVPLTTTLRAVPLHVLIRPPEGGLRAPSMALCQDLRSVSLDRLERRLGVVTPATLAEVELRIRAVLAIRGPA